jgi:gliding motility associated protien GldN
MLLFLFVSSGIQAQELETDSGYDSMSINRIHNSDVMWSKGLTRRMDLREKPNEPLFAKGYEFTRLLIEAVNDSAITAYKDASFSNRLSKAEFLKLMELPDFPDEEELEDAAIKDPDYFFPTDIYLMEMEEVLLFDKQRSRMYTDIKSITLFLSADHPDNIKGIDIPLATFSYRELSEKLFKDNANALWFNPYNDTAHLNLDDAFELRLFHSHIIKVSNPNDDYLIDIYDGDPKAARIASQMKAYELLEFESNLWEN